MSHSTISPTRLKYVIPSALTDTNFNIKTFDEFWAVVRRPTIHRPALEFYTGSILALDTWTEEAWDDDVVLFQTYDAFDAADVLCGIAVLFSDVIRRGRPGDTPIHPLSQQWWDWSLGQ